MLIERPNLKVPCPKNFQVHLKQRVRLRMKTPFTLMLPGAASVRYTGALAISIQPRTWDHTLETVTKMESMMNTAMGHPF